MENDQKKSGTISLISVPFILVLGCLSFFILGVVTGCHQNYTSLTLWFEFTPVMDVLKHNDICGIGTPFFIILFLINLPLFVFCLIKGIESMNEGWNYRINNKLIITFFSLAFITFLGMLILSNIENGKSKKMVDSWNNSKSSLMIDSDGTYTVKNNKTGSKVKKNNITSSDMQDITGYPTSPTVDRAIQLQGQNQSIVYWFLNIVFASSEGDAYYSIFVRFVVLDIIAGVFYWLSASLENEAKKSDILVNF